MAKKQDKDTRYFIDIDLKSLKVVAQGYDQKQILDKGRPVDPKHHRVFVIKGQYNKFVEQCAIE